MTDDLIAALKAGRMTLPRDAVIALEAQARRISELEEENRRLMHSFMRVDLLRGEQSARIAELEAALKELADEYAPRAFYGEADDAVQKARAAYLGETNGT